MHTIQILGNVLPKAMEVTTPGKQHAQWPIQRGLSTDFDYTITKGEIEIVCKCNRLDVGDFNEIYKRAYHSCRAVVDLLAFATGGGLLVHLHSVKWIDGKLWPIQSFRQELPPLVTAFNLEKSSLDAMTGIIGQHPNLLIVLNDLIDALNTPNHTPTHCARAI